MHVAASAEDRYTQLKSAVDSWAAEIAEVRSALAEQQSVKLDRRRPVFRLVRESVQPARQAPAISEPIPMAAEPAALSKTERQRHDQELAFAREQLLEQNRRADEARQQADEKAEQLEEMARAFGRTRLDLNDALEQLRAKEWALIQAGNENALLRGEVSGGALARTVHAEDYDALVESHLSIREEVTALQERVVQREHEIISLRATLDEARAELAAWESAGPASGAGIARMAGIIAARSATLERVEGAAQGQELLIGALRQELDAARRAIEQRDFDHTSLAQALRAEVEGLRVVSSERDFVIGHQAQTIESGSVQSEEMRSQLTEAQAQCESLRARVRQFEDERDEQTRELQLLRARATERDAEIWKLRGAVRTASSSANTEPGLAQLQAALASRDAELARARQRIEFLRGQSREAAGLSAMADAFAPEGAPIASVPRAPTQPEPESKLDLDGIQPNSRLQREVEAAFAAEFPWYLIGAIGGIAGVGLLLLGLIAMMLV